MGRKIIFPAPRSRVSCGRLPADSCSRGRTARGRPRSTNFFPPTPRIAGRRQRGRVSRSAVRLPWRSAPCMVQSCHVQACRRRERAIAIASGLGPGPGAAGADSFAAVVLEPRYMCATALNPIQLRMRPKTTGPLGNQDVAARRGPGRPLRRLAEAPVSGGFSGLVHIEPCACRIDEKHLAGVVRRLLERSDRIGKAMEDVLETR